MSNFIFESVRQQLKEISGLAARHIGENAALDDVRITDYEFVSYRKQLSQPDAIPEEEIAAALKVFQGRKNIGGRAHERVIFGTSSPSALTRFLQLPPVRETKIPEITAYEAVQQIPLCLDDVCWDWQLLSRAATSEGFALGSEVGLFAKKRDSIMEELAPLSAVGIDVDAIQINSLAMLNVMRHVLLRLPAKAVDDHDSLSREESEFIIGLDIGCDNTTLIATNGITMWIRNIPIGGTHFTRAITKEFRLTFANAEEQKRFLVNVPESAAASIVLNPVFKDFACEVQRSLGYFQSVNREAKVSRIVCFGNGSKIPGLTQCLSEAVNIPITLFHNPEILCGAIASAPGDAAFLDNLPTMAVAIGLALQGVDSAKMTTSLLPPELKKSVALKRAAQRQDALPQTITVAWGIDIGNAGIKAVRMERVLTAADVLKQVVALSDNCERAMNDAAAKHQKFLEESAPYLADVQTISGFESEARSLITPSIDKTLSEGRTRHVFNLDNPKEALLSMTAIDLGIEEEIGDDYEGVDLMLNEFIASNIQT